MLLNCGAGEDSRESLEQQGNQTSQSLRKSTLNIHWKDWCWSWGSNSLGHLMWRADSSEKTLMLGKIEGGRRRDDGGWAGWMASLTWWTWKWKWKCESLSHVWLLATPWTVALQAPLSMEFSGQEYWSGLPFPSAGVIPDPGIELRSPTLQADSLHLSHLGSCEFEQTWGDTEGHRNVVCSSPWGRKEWDKT